MEEKYNEECDIMKNCIQGYAKVLGMGAVPPPTFAKTISSSRACQ